MNNSPEKNAKQNKIYHFLFRAALVLQWIYLPYSLFILFIYAFWGNVFLLDIEGLLTFWALYALLFEMAKFIYWAMVLIDGIAFFYYLFKTQNPKETFQKEKRSFIVLSALLLFNLFFFLFTPFPIFY